MSTYGAEPDAWLSLDPELRNALAERVPATRAERALEQTQALFAAFVGGDYFKQYQQYLLGIIDGTTVDGMPVPPPGVTYSHREFARKLGFTFVD